MKNITWITGLIVLIGLIALYFLLQYAPAFGNMGEFIIYVGIIFCGIAAIDKYALPTIDLVTEIKKGNNAAGFLILAIALIFVAAAILVK